MSGEPVSENQQILVEALRDLRSALNLLDQGNAPAHIAAHIDLAMHQLQDAILSVSATDPSFSNDKEHCAPLIH